MKAAYGLNADSYMKNYPSSTTLSAHKRWRSLIRQGMVSLTLLSLIACQSSPSPDAQTPTPTPSPDLDSRLSLSNATLEQSDIKGEMLWKIQVETANYSADQQTAYLTNVKGNIFQDGKIVLKISANKGQINRNGENFVLKENIVAVDPRNQAVLRSEEVEWQPATGQLIVKQPLKGNDPNVDVEAKRAQYSAREQQLTLSGQIIATSRNPKLQLKTEHLLWQIPQKKIIGNKPLELTRYNQNIITDKVKAAQGIVQLDHHLVTLKNEIEYNSLEPPVQMAASIIRWQYKDRIVSTDKPIKLRHTPDDVTLTANQAVANLNAKVIHLHHGVRGNSPKDGGKLYSENLVYDLSNQAIAAVGNVVYEQDKPPFNLTGTQAHGLIQGETITNLVVMGDPQDRVVTEIFPE
ncbi:MAG: LPS export ABC transporter periplasmic protein LptC [Microcystaceae cyanobacterium]